MATYSQITASQIATIEGRLHSAVWNKTQALAFMGANGLIQPVPKGSLSFKSHTWDKMKPGQIARGFSDLPRSVAKISDNDNIIIELATKVVIPKNFRDAWAGSTQIPNAGDMLASVVSEQTNALRNQVDQFICNGDAMKTPLTQDKNKGEAVFTGLFNGFTNLSAGDGADDNVTAAGDYISTVASYMEALRVAGFEDDAYWLWSTESTYTAAQAGNNLYTTNTITTEMDAVVARKDIKGWMRSPNFENASANDQILMLSPRTGKGDPNFRLLQGYNFDVIPLFNGGLNGNGEFEIIVAWSGAVEELRATSVQRSGTLTLS